MEYRRSVFAAVPVVMAAIILLTGCAKKYEELELARADGAVLGERIFIDGTEVSYMGVDEAKLALLSAHESRMSGLVYTLTAGEDSVSFEGDELPVSYDPSQALLEAVNAKRRCPADVPAREFTGTYDMDAEKLRAVVSQYTAQLERPPVDAAVSFEGGGFQYTQEQPGRSIDETELAQSIGESWRESGTFEANTADIQAGYTLDMAKADTLRISGFSTSFSGSTYGKKNRVFNIVKAAQLLNGCTVLPGESFDMNGVLGDRNAQNGWKQAAAIRDGAYTSEYGGGVCQVSTTLYNAVLMADLEVVERHHHSWPLGYVDIGRDATISTDGPNFIFKNTTDMPVYILAFTNEKEKTVTVELYGRRSFEGRIELSSEKVETLSEPGYETQLDDSLPAGARVEERKARRGSVSMTYKHYYDANGALVRTELVCRDKYRSIKGLMLLAPDVYYGTEAASVLPVIPGE